MSRLENTANNAKWAIISTIVPLFLNMATRIVFMNVLGEKYLGINGLFASVLGVLSFADLGLASVFMFCFFKPISENDTDYILVLLDTCKKIFTAIALFIFVAGLAITPFLKFIIKGGEGIEHIPFYYLCSLLTTVMSYFLVHKTTYIAAKQKSYTLVPVEISMNMLNGFIQLLMILLFKNYIYYAVSGVVLVLIRQIVVNIYINKKYPEVKHTKPGPLKDTDVQNIKRNVKASITSKLGTIVVFQTDNIITSAFIDIATTGLLSNYMLIKNTVLSFVSLFNNSITASMGDLIASENKDVQLNIFYKYLILNSFILCVCFCGIGVMSSPFISLIFGATKVIDELSVFLICIAFYFSYQVYAVHVLSTSGGQMQLIAFSPIIESIVNLASSIVAAYFWGLPGVFLGTVLSSLTIFIINPTRIFHHMYEESTREYYKITISFFVTILIPYIISMQFRNIIMRNGITFVNFIIVGIVTSIMMLLIPYVLWRKNKHYMEAEQIIKNFIISKWKKHE